MSKHNVNFIILVRGGSKGIKNKNLSLIGDKTLLGHTITQAIESGRAKRIIVSSDSQEILDHALLYPGTEIVLRPAELSGDYALSIDAQLHAMEICGIIGREIVMNLQVTSPLRRPIHIRQATELLESVGKGSVVSVISGDHVQHPYKIILDTGEDKDITSRYQPVKDLETMSKPRQLLPKAYHLNGAIYANYAEEIIYEYSYYTAPLNIYIMPENLSADIDTPEDLAYVREIYERMLRDIE